MQRRVAKQPNPGLYAIITLAGFAAVFSYQYMKTTINTSPINRDSLDSCHWWEKVKDIVEFGPSALKEKEPALSPSFISALFLVQTLVGFEAQRISVG